MDSDQKFWLWLWMIIISGAIMLSLAGGKGVETIMEGRAAEFKVYLDKGYSPAATACAIDGDHNNCLIAKEEFEGKNTKHD